MVLLLLVMDPAHPLSGIAASNNFPIRSHSSSAPSSAAKKLWKACASFEIGPRGTVFSAELCGAGCFIDPVKPRILSPVGGCIARRPGRSDFANARGEGIFVLGGGMVAVAEPLAVPTSRARASAGGADWLSEGRGA